MVEVVVGIDDYHLGMVDSLVVGLVGIEDSHSHVAHSYSLGMADYQLVECSLVVDGIVDSHGFMVGIALVGVVVVGPHVVE